MDQGMWQKIQELHGAGCWCFFLGDFEEFVDLWKRFGLLVFGDFLSRSKHWYLPYDLCEIFESISFFLRGVGFGMV